MTTYTTQIGDLDLIWTDQNPNITPVNAGRGSWIFHQNGGLPAWYIKLDDGITTNIATLMARSNPAGTAPPAVTDDETKGYKPQSRYTDTVGQNEYTCISAAVGAALWKVVT